MREQATMKPVSRGKAFRSLLVMVCALGVVPGDTFAYFPTSGSVAVSQAQDTAAKPEDKAAKAENKAAKIPPEQLDSLVAPIALYPDPLLAQVLAASTYPLELIQLQQWLG